MGLEFEPVHLIWKLKFFGSLSSTSPFLQLCFVLSSYPKWLMVFTILKEEFSCTKKSRQIVD